LFFQIYFSKSIILSEMEKKGNKEQGTTICVS